MKTCNPLFKNPRFLMIFLSTIAIIFFILWQCKASLFLSDRYEWHVSLGYRYYFNGMNLGAKNAAEHALLLNDSNPKAYELKALACLKLGQIDCTRSALENLEKTGKTALYFEIKSVVEVTQANFSAERMFLEQSLATDPFYAPSYIDLGLLEIREGNMDDAMFHLNKGLFLVSQNYEQHHPDRLRLSGLAHMGYSLIAEKRGDRQKAAEEKRIASSYYVSSENAVRNIVS